jgi:hypothetical protein
MHQPRFGVLKAALAIKIEQMRLEIDMYLLNAAFTRHSDRIFYQSSPDTTALQRRMHRGVQHECMHAAVPREIDEANQPSISIRAHRRETAR